MNPLATYLRELRDIRASGANVPETSFYGPLANLLNAVGRTLKPRVRCIINPKNQGAGIPDGGFFTADQLPRTGEPDLHAQLPARGVMEVKGTSDDAWQTARSAQVAKYLGTYGQVLVTNYRDFILLGRDTNGKRIELETYRLAESEVAFWAATTDAHALVEGQGERFTEFLKRVMLYAAPLTNPADVAWFLASYARDARARIEDIDLPALTAVRTALEEALGVAFEGRKGDLFFRSTLVQTLFYGIFSAWVLWSRKRAPGNIAATFDWRITPWELHVPLIRGLFEQMSMPSKLGPLGLIEVLDRTGAALNRVEPEAFFARFEAGHAVQYFYEPFLEAFDPELRKELGVWYTPPEIVQYMVTRVDTVLREELGIVDGLADPRVYVLDPCCGTGAYLVAVLQRIATTLRQQGGDALLGDDLKRAAMERIFGFELLPAPFVVVHLQLGLLLQTLGAPLSDRINERVGVYLTNALTGWAPPTGPKQRLLFPELEAERDAAERVKRDVPILVILGNPPYNGFAGLAMNEERDLTNAYRTTKHAPAPQGQGLNDLYIRFFRMAERRIVERTGQGIICFISNYSWLDGLSFTGMREHYLEVFDKIWIDCLNGDKFKTGKLTPEGETDPSVFSTDFNPEGIQLGTAIALFVRRQPHADADTVRFRHLWGRTKRTDLLATAVQDGDSLYQLNTPALDLGLPYMPAQADTDYLSWPLLPDLFPVSFPGVQTGRDLDLVAIDLPRLEQRIQAYFSPTLSDDAVRLIAPSLMTSSSGYDASATRKYLVPHGVTSGHFVRYCYQPFDTRYVYWHPETKLLDRKREELFAGARAGNIFLTSRQKAERQNEGTPFYLTRDLPDRHLTRPGSICFPLTCNGFTSEGRSLFGQATTTVDHPAANLSSAAQAYLVSLGIVDPNTDAEAVDLLWMHTLAIGYSPAYLAANAGGLRQDWPRIPMPGTAELLHTSAALGRQVAALLDTERPVPGVTSGKIRPELQAIGIITRAGGGTLNPAAGDLAVTAGWGHAGKGGVTMPGKGRVDQRAYTPDELAAIHNAASALGLTEEQAVTSLGATSRDVYLNNTAYWRNIPAGVWEYTIGGYQVIKKWLSYREHGLLGRALTTDEAREVTHMARRIAAIVLLSPALDANYMAVKDATLSWAGLL
ncbi:MAG: type ISP restriction/modification enzyme [Candidatus Entotheonellia bacterium]